MNYGFLSTVINLYYEYISPTVKRIRRFQFVLITN